MTTKKRPKALRGLSDSLLLSLWREVVKRRYDWTCVICGQQGGEDLQAHHIVERSGGHSVLKFDPQNGVPVCGMQAAPQSIHGESCHDFAASLEGHEFLEKYLGRERWAYLMEKERVLLDDEMATEGLTRAEWRRRWRVALEEELRRG